MNEIFALVCFFSASVLVMYLVLPEKPDRQDEVTHALEEMRSCLSSLGDLISRQNECFLQTMGIVSSMNGKLDGMFSVMKTPNGKGRMGEWQLESLLKSVRTNSGLSYLVKPDLKGGKPDFAIPVGSRYLYIDSKLPYDSYKAYLENPTEQNFKSFLSAVKRCADSIKEKYVSAEDSIGTTVLYLPSEGMMRDILEHYPKLVTDLESEGVVLLSSLYLPFFLRLFTDCCSLVGWEKSFAAKRFEISSLISKAGKELFDLGKDIKKVEASFLECKHTVSDLSGLLNPKE